MLGLWYLYGNSMLGLWMIVCRSYVVPMIHLCHGRFAEASADSGKIILHTSEKCRIFAPRF